MKRTKKKPRPPINIEELTMAKLADEINTTLKVHLEPSKPKRLTKSQKVNERINPGNFDINPYDALTRFDVTITGQVLDIPLKLGYPHVMISQVDNIVKDAASQLQWIVQNRLQELKMKYDYEEPIIIKINKDML